MIELYGIANCDTIRKAKKWLDSEQIAYAFCDYKKQAPTADILQHATDSFGWEAVLNKRGTTWRKLSDAQKEGVQDAATAIALMCEQPSCIKRPLVMRGDEALLLGFDAEKWREVLK